MPPKESSRVPKACQLCNKQKLRCTGVEFENGQPIPDANGQICCNRCKRNNAVCSFDRPPKKRAPKQDLVKTLQQRIKELEAQFHVAPTKIKEESESVENSESDDDPLQASSGSITAPPLHSMTAFPSFSSSQTFHTGPWRPGHEPRDAKASEDSPIVFTEQLSVNDLWNILNLETETGNNMMDWDGETNVVAALTGPTGAPLHQDVFLAGGFDQPNPMLQSNGIDPAVQGQLEVLFQQFITNNMAVESPSALPATPKPPTPKPSRVQRQGSIHNPSALPVDLLAKHEAADPYFFLPEPELLKRLVSTFAEYSVHGMIRTIRPQHFVKNVRNQPPHLVAAVLAAASLIEGCDSEGNPPNHFDPSIVRPITDEPPQVSGRFRFFYDCCLFLLNRSLLFRPTPETIETLAILGFIRASMASWRDALVPMTTLPGIVAVLGLDRDPDLKRARQQRERVPSATPSSHSNSSDKTDKKKTLLEARIDALEDASSPKEEVPVSVWMEQESLRRIYWFAFTHDRLRAFYSGRRPMIHDEDCRVSLPAPDHLWTQFDQDPGKAPHHTPFIYWVDPDGSRFPPIPASLLSHARPGPYGASAMCAILWRIFVRVNDFRSWQFERDQELGKDLSHEYDREFRHRLMYCEKMLDDWFQTLPVEVRALGQEGTTDPFVGVLNDVKSRGSWLLQLMFYYSARIHLFGNGELVSLFRGGHKVNQSGWISWKECMQTAQCGALVLERLTPSRMLEIGPGTTLGLLQQAAVFLMTMSQPGEIQLTPKECRFKVGQFVQALQVLGTTFTTCFNLAGILQGNLETALDGVQ